MKTTILCVVGTRPEVIKMAPIILALQEQTWANVRVMATAQHREMLDDTLSIFGIKPDVDLNIMRAAQQLPALTARLLISLDEALAKENPDVVLAQGDTTTVLTTALACFYRKISFCHVEAGLRTHDIHNPFPEEMNRLLASRLATLHFAPTEIAKNNLLSEGINEKNIQVTGNTVIDALLKVSINDAPLDIHIDKHKKNILLTVHRRENFGQGLKNIFEAVRELVEKYEDMQIIYPVHPNPQVYEVAYQQLNNVKGVTLCAPFNYEQLVTVMKQSWLVLTDSGGLQEEAPALAKPVLVLREETERPEAIACGVAKLVGSNKQQIIETVEWLRAEVHYQSMAKHISPYGDGAAARRIVDRLKATFHLTV